MQAYVVLDGYFEDPLVLSQAKGNTIKRIVIIDDKKTIVVTPRKKHVFVDTVRFSLNGCEVVKEVDIDESLVDRLLAAAEEQKLLNTEITDLIEMGM